MVRVRVPRKAGRWSTYDVYADDGTALLLQSPMLTMPYTPIRDDIGNFSVDVCMYNAKEAFFDEVDRLCGDLRRRLCTHDPRLASWSWLGGVREAEGGYERRLRLKGCDTWIRAFDIHKAPCHFKDIKRDDRFRALVHVRQVVADEGAQAVVIRLDLVQVQRMEPVFATLMIADATPEPFPGHLAKYQRMLKSGVAREAVEHKMTMDGFAQDMPLMFGSTKAPPPMAGLFAVIKSGVSLKSAERSVKQQTVQKPEGPKPPTLADILAARGGLRPLREAFKR